MRHIYTPIDLDPTAAPGADTNFQSFAVSDHVPADVRAPLKMRVTACFASDTALRVMRTRGATAEQTILLNSGNTLGAEAAGEFGLRVAHGDTIAFQITVDGAIRVFTVDIAAEGAD